MRGGTKILAIVTIIIILISIGLSGCFEEEKDDDEIKESNVIVHYEIEIIQDRNINYTIYVPILSLFNEGSSEIIKEIKFIEGSGKTELINTSNGNALKIVSNSTKLRMESKLNKYKASFLTMEDKLSEDKNDFWLFYNASEITKVSFKLFIENKDSKGGGVKFFTDPEYQNISLSWNKIYIKNDAWDT